MHAGSDQSDNMASIAVVPAASLGGGGGDVSVRMPAAAAAAASREEGGDGAAPNGNLEKQLSRFARYVAFGEWAGNAFGALAFLWATGVLLGGFRDDLHRLDFWFATVMIFIEAFRIFSRNYKLDSQSLFGTTRALRWRNSSFLSMLGRPQEGNSVVLILGFWLNLINNFLFETIAKLEFWIKVLVQLFLTTAVFVTWIRQTRRPKQWQIRAAAVAYVLATIQKLKNVVSSNTCTISLDEETLPSPHLLFCMLPLIIEDVAVLLVNLRPRRIANLTSTPCGRKLVSLAKLTSALWLAINGPLTMLSIPWQLYYSIPILLYVKDNLCEPFALLVLSLGSLQNHAQGSRRWSWTDAIMHIAYLFYSVVSPQMSIVDDLMTGLPKLSVDGLSCMLLLVLLLSGNLQIPAAVAQIMLSSRQLTHFFHPVYYNPHLLPSGSSYNYNMEAAIAVFYLLALCQGSLYVMASFLGLLSAFPRRWLMRRSKLGGKLGAKAIDLYYEHAYATRMEMGMFGAAGRTGSFADFAIESLSSGGSRDLQVAGLCVLHNMMQQRRSDCCSKDLTLRVTSSSTVVSTLVGMLAWTDMEDDNSYTIIRLLAAIVTAKLAVSLRISSIPGILKLVSSLLAESTDAVVLLPNRQGQGHQQTPLAIANGGSVQLAQGSSNGTWRSWAVCQFWQRMKEEYWSIPGEPTLSQQDSPPVLGMVILEKLARDLDNCVEIFKDDTTNLISKTIGIIDLATIENQQNDALVCSALKFLRRLATTGERIGASLRHELWNHPFLLNCLARVLEDDSNGSPQLWEPAMDIIAKLALDRAAGLEIGRIQVITTRLLHAFLGRQGSTNMYYDQTLRKVSGEALANLALWGTANCSAILEEPAGYQVINDLTNMLSDDDHRYVATSLLLNLCAHCSVNLLLSHPHAREHLSLALTTVMEHMMAAEGKQLESLISLASEIGDVLREAFAHELESQTNSGAKLVQKLFCTLSSKKIPNPEYPRLRRVIVKILISILESCHSTVEKLMEEGMMERLMASLTKIERSPSRVEEYRVFYGNIGVVPEDGEPMSTLVARAKALLVQHTTQTAAGPIGGSFMIPHP